MVEAWLGTFFPLVALEESLVSLPYSQQAKSLKRATVSPFLLEMIPRAPMEARRVPSLKSYLSEFQGKVSWILTRAD